MQFHLLPAVVATIIIAISSPVLAGEVDGLVAKKAAIVAKLHKKAEKALINAAQDKSYVAFLSSDVADRHEHRNQIDQVSLKVQEKFHVEEMCLIDASGPELARIVGKAVADDLSPDESGAVFFKPGFELKAKKAYISPTYMSPDADKWVIAYVTPVVVAGDNKAILHYEHGLEVYQNALNKGVKDQWILAVNQDGFIVSDSRKSISVDKQGDQEEPSAYFANFTTDGKNLDDVKNTLDQKSPLSIGGVSYVGAYKQVRNWTILGLQPQ